MPNNETDPEHVKKVGKRTDGRNLIREYLTKTPGAQYLWNKTKFDELDVKTTKNVLGMSFNSFVFNLLFFFFLWMFSWLVFFPSSFID